MKFRPCIDLRNGKVVQIVGGTLSDNAQQSLVTNFESARTPAQFARLYQGDRLFGGHVIALGPGNIDAALESLGAFPGGLQMGGGINPENAHTFLDAGASHVIVTSYVFSKGRMDMDKLNALVSAVGRKRLVLDLSCRKRDGQFWIVTDRWQNFTQKAVTPAILEELSGFCDEFLIHGVDVEGQNAGYPGRTGGPARGTQPHPRHLCRGCQPLFRPGPGKIPW